MAANIPQFGSISTGTLIEKDLLAAFSAEILWLDPMNREMVAFAAKCDQALEQGDGNEIGYLLEEAYEHLDEYALPFMHFGTNEGDGADFGWWPSIDALEDSVKFEEVQKVDDTSKINGSTEFAMHVNDHGNVTLYRTETIIKEVWAVV